MLCKFGKRSANSTPKKNGTEVESEDAPPVITDLKLDAKLKAQVSYSVKFLFNDYGFKLSGFCSKVRAF